MTDDLQVNSAVAHARCWNLLPWWVNGTLSAEESGKVENHVGECTECAAELELQRRVQAQLRDGDVVLMAPQSAWQKMAERLDGEDEALARGGFKRRSKTLGVWPWAVAAQALVIVGLITVVWQQARSPDGATMRTAMEPRYETLTAAATDSAVARDAVRVVFRRDVSVAEVNALLRESAAQIVAGPTEAGVYVLRQSPAHSASIDTAGLLKALRADGRVIFAEPEYR